LFILIYTNINVPFVRLITVSLPNKNLNLKTIMAVVHKSKIEFEIGLDENKVPEKMSWNAQDGGVEKDSTKAIMLSVWDDKKKDTLRIDLWTKDMPVDEMKQFFHQTLVSMSHSFERATNDEKMAETMRDFCDYFEEKLELKK
jgi:gliding motility-associated protein GldC